jgi:hypothetical protein
MYLHEIALAVATVTPVVAVVGIDVYLALRGETDTLLLPRLLAFPSQPIEPIVAPISEARAPAVTVEAAMPEMEMEPLRKAA